jgi:hypothetical protein
MAIDILSIPASSAECERMFLELGDMLQLRRKCLSSRIIAALQCIKVWQRHFEVQYATFGRTGVDEGNTELAEHIDSLYHLEDWEEPEEEE